MIAPDPAPAPQAPPPTEAQVWEWLSQVPDPEIPAVSIVDLGIVRAVAVAGEAVTVTVTPTYSGCPATAVIALQIKTALRDRGVADLRLLTRIAPPWTTDWISPEGRARLLAYGIAPPVDGTAPTGRRVARLSGGGNLVVACPRCASPDTEEVSRFGSTPCKAAWRCRACAEPFDYFKCH